MKVLVFEKEQCFEARYNILFAFREKHRHACVHTKSKKKKK